MDSQLLASALRDRARALSNVDEEHPLTRGQLADDSELLRVLARIVEGKPVPQAFGRPGDWGYEHPIGKALAK